MNPSLVNTSVATRSPSRVFSGRRFSHTPSAAALLCASLGLATAAPAAVIAHWSFDTPSITVDGTGNVLSAADSTGNHNATGVINGTGTSASVAGQFGQGLQLNNTTGSNQGENSAYLNIPQLTELMGESGSSYTVAAWVNLENTGNNAILADWGNAAAGEDRFPYWFAVNGARPRAHARFGTGNGTDMYARQVANTPENLVADGEWHHVAWTFDKEIGQLTTYRDGVQIDQFTAPGLSYDMMVGSSPIGSIGRKSDNNDMFVGAMDELWVFGAVLEPSQVQTLMTANVNPIPEPGSVALIGVGAALLALTRRRA